MEEFGLTSTEISRKDSDRDVTFSHHKHLVSLTVSPWKTSWIHVCFSFSSLLLGGFVRILNASLMPPEFGIDDLFVLSACFPEPFLVVTLLLSSLPFTAFFFKPTLGIALLPSSVLNRLPFETLDDPLPKMFPPSLVLELLFES